MALELYRTDRVEMDYDVDVKDENGNPVTITSVEVAILPHRTGTDATTAFVSKTVTAGVVTLVYTGPDATPVAGDLLLDAGITDVFFNDVNGDFRKAKMVDTVTVR